MALFLFRISKVPTTTTSFNPYHHRKFSKFSLAKLRGNCSTSFSTGACSSSTATNANAMADLQDFSASPSPSGVKKPPTIWWGPDSTTGTWVPVREGQQVRYTDSVSVDHQQPWFREDVHLHYHSDHRSA